ncbi:penicillin-binding protein 1C [Solimonas aquatica]|uniref:peptidoglycan glycosyltransferase n=1 Tax=Solimonas aquatica TaxID=489703 RepID=A0A1H9IT13_9GAMM|nr:transglycosylase domain-containing protein [Solimonas aquatica]SEQ77720.1 penicillin-binding protein 1C [Solimonas aquatica]
MKARLLRGVKWGALAALSLLMLATLLSQRALPERLQPSLQGAPPQILDREGQPLHSVYDGGLNLYEQRALEAMPLALRQAFVEAEDRRFWRHSGVDWRARAMALRVNLRAGRALRGASTISEQVVRILNPRPRTLWSRWVEGFEAWRLEARFNKSEILEFYLNQVPYGGNRRGVVQAADYYFARSLDTLSQDEMLALAVLVRAPSRLAREPQALLKRVQQLAQRLQLPPPQDLLALQRRSAPLEAAYFLAQLERELATQVPQRASLRSSLDSGLQADTERYLAERLQELSREGAQQAAALVVDLDGNRVRAYAAADARAPQAIGIDPLQVPRQPGSTLKPLLYALSLEQGWRADTVIEDATLRERVNEGLHEYRNYSRQHYGAVTLAEALGNSLNIPAVKALQFVGQERFLSRLQDLGVRSLRQSAAFYGDGLALGNGELSLFELVQAYTALAREGLWQPLSLREDGEAPLPRRLIRPEAARAISGILADADSRRLEFGDGSLLSFAQRTAVKTGTSSDYRDAWTIAYNGRYLLGIWVGNLSGRATQGVTGARGPALLARSLLARLPEAGALRAAPPPSALARAAPAAEPQAEDPVLLQPFEGLLMARDPRIPETLQAFRFELGWRQPLRSVRWELDGEFLAQTADKFLDWPLSAGVHRLRAVATAASGASAATPEVSFRVR